MTDGHEPATKADLETLKTELQAEFKSDLGSVKAELIAHIETNRGELMERIEMNRAETQHNFDALREQMRDMQTEMLKAFYAWAQSTDAKLKDSESSDSSFRARLSALESRQAELEKRLLEMRINQPPQPPQ